MIKHIDKELEKRFSTVFKKRLWGDGDSISGPGSHRNDPMRVQGTQAIDEAVTRFGVHSIADIPCGDLAGIEDAISLHPDIYYVGYDIVKEIIQANRKKYPQLKFEHFDMVSNVLPRFDLIFCKELLIHLSNKDIIKSLANVKASGSSYFIASNSFGINNEELEHNYDGYARPVDVMGQPFNLPSPVWNNGLYGLWRCSEFPDYVT